MFTLIWRLKFFFITVYVNILNPWLPCKGPQSAEQLLYSSPSQTVFKICIRFGADK